MDIKINEVYKNMTYTYLLPALTTLYPEFTSLINEVVKIGVGVGDDRYYSSTGNRYRNSLFMLIDINGINIGGKYVDPVRFVGRYNSLKGYLRSYGILEGYYDYDDIENGTLRMLILKLPYKNMVKHFKAGRFSKLYPHTPRIVNGVTKEVSGVIFKTEKYGKRYVNNINRIYDTNIPFTDFKEYESKPVLSNEIFNYTKNVNHVRNKDSQLIK